MTNPSNEEIRRKKISELKDKISDSKDYINSDFCENCNYHYRQIEIYKKELENLLNYDK